MSAIERGRLWWRLGRLEISWGTRLVRIAWRIDWIREHHLQVTWQ